MAAEPPIQPPHVPAAPLGIRPETRSKVIQILSGNANGCLEELGYTPGVLERVRELEAANESLRRECRSLYERAEVFENKCTHYQQENVKLYEDNRRVLDNNNALRTRVSVFEEMCGMDRADILTQHAFVQAQLQNASDQNRRLAALLNAYQAQEQRQGANNGNRNSVSAGTNPNMPPRGPPLQPVASGPQQPPTHDMRQMGHSPTETHSAGAPVRRASFPMQQTSMSHGQMQSTMSHGQMQSPTAHSQMQTSIVHGQVQNPMSMQRSQSQSQPHAQQPQPHRQIRLQGYQHPQIVQQPHAQQLQAPSRAHPHQPPRPQFIQTQQQPHSQQPPLTSSASESMSWPAPAMSTPGTVGVPNIARAQMQRQPPSARPPRTHPHPDPQLPAHPSGHVYQSQSPHQVLSPLSAHPFSPLQQGPPFPLRRLEPHPGAPSPPQLQSQLLSQAPQPWQATHPHPHPHQQPAPAHTTNQISALPLELATFTSPRLVRAGPAPPGPWPQRDASLSASTSVSMSAPAPAEMPVQNDSPIDVHAAMVTNAPVAVKQVETQAEVRNRGTALEARDDGAPQDVHDNADTPSEADEAITPPESLKRMSLDRADGDVNDGTDPRKRPRIAGPDAETRVKVEEPGLKMADDAGTGLRDEGGEDEDEDEDDEMDEDEDVDGNEEEFIEVDQDGLRTVESCVTDVFDSRTGMCRFCLNLKKKGVLSEPPRFAGASTEECAAHLQAEHWQAWTLLRRTESSPSP